MKVKIIRNPKKSWTERISKNVHNEAIRKGWNIVSKGADATILIGGDGTFYYHKNKVEGQVFCIGSEHSYLGVNYRRWKDIFNSSKWKEYSINGIDVYEGKHRIGWAINDVYLKARKTVLRIRVHCSRTYVFIGDGVVISTPIGSTAYNFSCGGSILDWGVDALVITSIAPHLRSFLSIVYKGNVGLKWYGDGDIFLDGQKKTIKSNNISIVKGKPVRMMKYVDKRHQKSIL